MSNNFEKLDEALNVESSIVEVEEQPTSIQKKKPEEKTDIKKGAKGPLRPRAHGRQSTPTL